MSAVCASCKGWRGSRSASGESQLYSPNRPFILCEPCWLDEDDMVDEAGTNDLPDVLARYAGRAAQ